MGGGGGVCPLRPPRFRQACLKWWAMQKVQSHQHHQSRYSGHKTNFKRNELMECFYEQKSHKSQHQKKWFFYILLYPKFTKRASKFSFDNLFWLDVRKVCKSEKIFFQKKRPLPGIWRRLWIGINKVAFLIAGLERN